MLYLAVAIDVLHAMLMVAWVLDKRFIQGFYTRVLDRGFIEEFKTRGLDKGFRQGF